MIVSIASCKNDNPSKPEVTKVEKEAQAMSKIKNSKYKPLPNEMLMELWNKCDLIDYIFHNLPFSMNQGEQASIRTNLTYISPDLQADIPSDCKSLGRQIFSIEGNIVLESDIYYTDKCAFFIYFVDGKALYANKMSEAGKQFYTTMIQKGLEAGKSRQ
jgi:hypothetical protein